MHKGLLRRFPREFLFYALLALGPFIGRIEAAELWITPRPTGHPLLSATAAESDLIVLEASDNLRDWQERWRGIGPLTNVADLTPPPPASTFYRAWTRRAAGTDDWKNLIRGDADGFQSPDETPWDPKPRWIKFLILLEDPHRVYFQDSARYAFHYDFAVARLPRFENLTRSGFDAITLHLEGQQAVLGAVLFSPGGSVSEAGIQFVGQDPYPRESIAAWFQTVRAAIMASPGFTTFYLPTFEQTDVARLNEDWFALQGIPVGAPSRWVTSDECYSLGWAMGRLVRVNAANLEAAYREGQIRPDDILLIDGVPAEVPPLAGIISLSPATPNSHVALLAKSFGIPFIHLADPDSRSRLEAWAGRDILLRAMDQFLGCDASVDAAEGPIPPSMREDIQDSHAPPPLDIPPWEHHGLISVSTDDLGPGDLRYVGGKAANFGVLRRSIAAQTPTPSLAFTFDLWEGYLQQVLPGGQTLAQFLNMTLGSFAWPPDMGALQTALEKVRDTVQRNADFSADQKQAIMNALVAAGFNPRSNIRFRSSTNVEDSEQFTGAGLYDSFSGCLADDQDADERGPSICDPTESSERGVFRALRKVFASFYNDNAFLERLRHHIDEAHVGMAVLVHPSTPDSFELANGVGTLRIDGSGPNRYLTGSLVTQAGAESVANPDSAARPEVVEFSMFTGGVPQFDIRQQSSLVPLGGHVLSWPKEYQALFGLLDLAGKRWALESPPRESWLLDFEYKKEAPGERLQIKQIRPLPIPKETSPGTRWLFNTTNAWVVQQGEFGDLMAIHRLKSFWTFETPHTALMASNLNSTLFGRVQGRWYEGTQPIELDAPMATLPDHEFSHPTDATRDTWQTAAGLRTIEVHLDRYAPPARGPVATLSDFRIEARMHYATPQPIPVFNPGGNVGSDTTHEETVFLMPQTAVSAGSKLQDRVWKVGSREIRTTFYWPPDPTGVVAGYTAPLQAWVETVLTGFTPHPIRLKGDFSQTYHPGHHNFWEEFLFDPWLEPGTDPMHLEELTAANIRAVVLTWDRSEVSVLGALGLDGKFRSLR